jgi:peptidyl-prolyl cis-trans isomerase C
MSWFRISLTLMAVCLLAAPYGMAQQTAPAKDASTPDMAHDVLAIVNGATLTKMDYEQLLQQYRPEARSEAEQNKGRFMRELVLQEILAQEGQRLQIEDDPQLQARLKIQKNSAIARAVVQKYIEEKSDVTDERLRDHYEKNKATFTSDEQIAASHILLKTEAEAQAALKEIKQGKDFAEVAKAKSTGPSAPQGGALGTFGRGRMVPAFEEAAFALKVGDVSAPVKTQFGYHIITVTDRTEAAPQSFDEVRDTIRRTLISEYVESLLDDLQSKAKIEIKNPEYTLQDQ